MVTVEINKTEAFTAFVEKTILFDAVYDNRQWMEAFTAFVEKTILFDAVSNGQWEELEVEE
jgi:hypothetical protein